MPAAPTPVSQAWRPPSAETWRAVPQERCGGTPLLSRPHWVLRLGAGQRPSVTGQHWTQSKRAGAAPRGADSPGLGCQPGGGYLGAGVGVRVRLGGAPGKGWPTGIPQKHSCQGQSFKKCLRDTGKKTAKTLLGSLSDVPGSPENRWGLRPALNLTPHLAPCTSCSSSLPEQSPEVGGVAVGLTPCLALAPDPPGQDLGFPHSRPHTPWAVPQLCCHSDKKK